MVDKRLGNDRIPVGLNKNVRSHESQKKSVYKSNFKQNGSLTKGSSPLEGSYAGFQPKPAVEVIIVAMKPLSEKTFVDQALKNGKGISWLDSARIPVDAVDTSAYIPALAQDFSDENAVGSLLQAFEHVRDVQMPTTSCSKNCTVPDHHAFDSDCKMGKELYQWLYACLYGGAKREKPDYESQDSQYDCLVCSDSCDGLFPNAIKDGLSVSPLQDDALAYICHFLQLHNDSQTLCTGLLSNGDELLGLARSYYHYTTYGQQVQQGRFPANLLVSDDVLNDGVIRPDNSRPNSQRGSSNWVGGERMTRPGISDSGSYSRYFDLDKWASTLPFLIVPKASKSEKNAGLDGFEEKFAPKGNNVGRNMDNPKNHMGGMQGSKAKNYHPTVKPLKLMSYLITLFSREGDIVLDPFCGSGTTRVAAKELGRDYIGIDREAEYVEIAKSRIEAAQEPQPSLL